MLLTGRQSEGQTKKQEGGRAIWFPGPDGRPVGRRENGFFMMDVGDDDIVQITLNLNLVLC